MIPVKVAGVPEHFNFPWIDAVRNGEFLQRDIELQWIEVPEGTGKMCQMLRDGAADVAIVLTEGIVRDINNGNPSRIVRGYVESPLIWGIHVAAQSAIRSVDDLPGKTVAISRYGSGSHLMAFIHAQQQGWKTEDLRFEIVNTIDGAIEALQCGRADYFMWEKFMTKPLVERGVFRRVGECPTPWPCFVIAAGDAFIEKHPEELKKVLEILGSKLEALTADAKLAAKIARHLNLDEDDIRQWLSVTKWTSDPPQEEVLNKVQNQLLELSLIEKKSTFAEMVKPL